MGKSVIDWSIVNIVVVSDSLNTSGLSASNVPVNHADARYLQSASIF